MKTRIRRLYDIANILQSLQLIQKVQITESHGAKKPAFEYIGPNISDMGKTKSFYGIFNVWLQCSAFENHICNYTGNNLMSSFQL